VHQLPLFNNNKRDINNNKDINNNLW